MVELTRGIIDGFQKLKKEYTKRFIDEDVLMNMDAGDLEMAQLTIKLMDDSMALMEEQAKLLDGMDDKLNKLLSK